MFRDSGNCPARLTVVYPRKRKSNLPMTSWWNYYSPVTFSICLRQFRPRVRRRSSLININYQCQNRQAFPCTQTHRLYTVQFYCRLIQFVVRIESNKKKKEAKIENRSLSPRPVRDLIYYLLKTKHWETLSPSDGLTDFFFF